jgi:hypothetical protein
MDVRAVDFARIQERFRLESEDRLKANPTPVSPVDYLTAFSRASPAFSMSCPAPWMVWHPVVTRAVILSPITERMIVSFLIIGLFIMRYFRQKPAKPEGIPPSVWVMVDSIQVGDQRSGTMGGSLPINDHHLRSISPRVLLKPKQDEGVYSEDYDRKKGSETGFQI